jgi:hypothetical protein
VERVKKAEEEQERLRKAEEERRRQEEEAAQALLVEEEHRRRAEKKQVTKPPSLILPPDLLKSTPTLDTQSSSSTLTRPVRGFKRPPMAWTPSTQSIQENAFETEPSPVEKARNLLEVARAVPTGDKRAWVLIGIGLLNLVGISIWLGILLQAWWIFLWVFLGELMLVIFLAWVEEEFVPSTNRIIAFTFELIEVCIPIGIAWGTVGWFLNPIVSFPLHLPFSTLILPVLGFLLGFFVNFFLCLLLIHVLRLEE